MLLISFFTWKGFLPDEEVWQDSQRTVGQPHCTVLACSRVRGPYDWFHHLGILRRCTVPNAVLMVHKQHILRDEVTCFRVELPLPTTFVGVDC